MSSNVTTSIEDVTPEMAAEWLGSLNTHNRPLRESKVAAYARDMENGSWVFNGDAIRFARGGVVLDGQHRLAAVVRSGVPAQFVIVRGLAAESQETIDIGAPRRLGDQLTLRGMINGKDLAAIARRVLTYDRTGGVPGSNFHPTHAEVIKYVERTPEIHRATEVALLARSRRTPVAGSVVGAAFHVCARLDANDAEMFYVVQLIDCIGLNTGDPAHTLLMRYQREVTVGGRQMEPDNMFRYAVMAWNAYRRGRKLSKLQAPHGGWTKENMPRPE